MTLQRVIEHRAAGRWPAAEAVATVSLDYDDRRRRRLRLSTDQGGSVLLDLPRPTAMLGGDGLLCDDGRWIAVSAKPEPLLDIRAASPIILMRLVWHLGNRHAPAEIRGDAVLIRPDHVLAEMARGLGCTVAETFAPFEAEGGAYGGHAH